MSRPEPKAGYERRDANRGLVLAVGTGIVVVTVIALFLMRGLLGVLETGEQRRQPEPVSLAAGDTPTDPPAPRLETKPGNSLAALRAREHEILTGYGWVDEDQGEVHIPIDRAMELIVERGLLVQAEQEASR